MFKGPKLSGKPLIALWTFVEYDRGGWFDDEAEDVRFRVSPKLLFVSQRYLRSITRGYQIGCLSVHVHWGDIEIYHWGVRCANVKLPTARLMVSVLRLLAPVELNLEINGNSPPVNELIEFTRRLGGLPTLRNVNLKVGNFYINQPFELFIDSFPFRLIRRIECSSSRETASIRRLQKLEEKKEIDFEPLENLKVSFNQTDPDYFSVFSIQTRELHLCSQFILHELHKSEPLPVNQHLQKLVFETKFGVCFHRRAEHDYAMERETHLNSIDPEVLAQRCENFFSCLSRTTDEHTAIDLVDTNNVLYNDFESLNDVVTKLNGVISENIQRSIAICEVAVKSGVQNLRNIRLNSSVHLIWREECYVNWRKQLERLATQWNVKVKIIDDESEYEEVTVIFDHQPLTARQPTRISMSLRFNHCNSASSFDDNEWNERLLDFDEEEQNEIEVLKDVVNLAIGQ
ncbi:hypothetical protein M3Y94_01297900 [Aphelenchoides besseyi]|nr:hypothetical protein M3Y94_01297900 [Aphelenchoides besseyi]